MYFAGKVLKAFITQLFISDLWVFKQHPLAEAIYFKIYTLLSTLLIFAVNFPLFQAMPD